MTSTARSVTLQRHGAADIARLLDTLTAIWADAHAEDQEVAAAGFTPDTLRRQITGHTRHDSFTLITAHSEGICVGFGYGFRCTPVYWFGKDLLPLITGSARTAEDLVGICELAVRRSWQSRGVGSRIHAAILDALQPEWASLLVMPNSNAKPFYQRLGYHYSGPYRAGTEGPVLDLLLLHRGNTS